MKFTIVLSALMTIFAIQIGDATDSTSLEAFNNLKIRAQTTTDSLSRFNVDLPPVLKSELSRKKNGELEIIYEIGDSTLREIRLNIAKGAGKYVQQCYGPAGLEMWVKLLLAERKLNDCKKPEVALINTMKNDIESAIVMGNILVNALNEVLIDCYTWNSTQVDNCLGAQIPRANVSLTGLENYAQSLHAAGGTIMQYDRTKCEDGIMENLLQEMEVLSRQTSECVEKVHV